MCILIKKFFLCDITWSVKGDICIEVRENVLSKIKELIGHLVKDIYRNCICTLVENFNGKFYFSENIHNFFLKIDM